MRFLAYDLSLDLIRNLREPLATIRRHDAALAGGARALAAPGPRRGTRERRPSPRAAGNCARGSAPVSIGSVVGSRSRQRDEHADDSSAQS